VPPGYTHCRAWPTPLAIGSQHYQALAERPAGRPTTGTLPDRQISAFILDMIHEQAKPFTVNQILIFREGSFEIGGKRLRNLLVFE